ILYGRCSLFYYGGCYVN
ncbi:hypothetical protein BV011_01140B, partial [Haemophilus influenzae]